MISSHRSSSCYAALCWCLGALFLFAILGLVHSVALVKIELQEAFILMNTKTIHNMALITFVDNHRSWALGYLIVFLTVLAFSSLRRHPWWAICLSFAGLAAPCLMYFNVCTHIVGKLIAL